VGSTLSTDDLGTSFDFMLSNPPYGNPGQRSKNTSRTERDVVILVSNQKTIGELKKMLMLFRVLLMGNCS
jgi:type I restriction-modification system DNA methylase subunit